MGLLRFIGGIFSDGGSPSYSRVGSFIALVCAMKWVNTIVAKTLVIPDLLNILYLVGGLYFINRLPEILAAIPGAKKAVADGAAGGLSVTSTSTVVSK